MQAQQLWLTGLVVPRHVGSSQARNRTHIPQAGSQPLDHQGSPSVHIFKTAQYGILEPKMDASGKAGDVPIKCGISLIVR